MDSEIELNELNEKLFTPDADSEPPAKLLDDSTDSDVQTNVMPSIQSNAIEINEQVNGITIELTPQSNQTDALNDKLNADDECMSPVAQTQSEFRSNDTEQIDDENKCTSAVCISSPSECDDATIDKNWCLNESIGGSIYGDSMDDEPESDEDRYDQNDLKQSYKEEDSNPKSNMDCHVFELTDDNSSIDDTRSEVYEGIDADEMAEEEEDSDFSDENEVHNIDDSDDETEETIIQNVHETSESQDNKFNNKSRSFEQQMFDDKIEKLTVKQRIKLMKSELLKQSATKLRRYLAIKRSIKFFLKKTTMRENRGVNRMVEVLNSDIDAASTSNIVAKSPIDALVLKERNVNETSETKHTNDTKINDDNDLKSNQSASEMKLHQRENDLLMSLDLEDIDYDDKCAKGLTSEGDNQTELGMDVDEPNENLYVSNKDVRPFERTTNKCNDEHVDNEIDTTKPTLKDPIVNGINKLPNKDDENTDITKIDNEQLTKTNKRKISISSDDEQEPPAKNPRNEIESNFSKHDQMMRRMIESTNKNDPDNLQRNIEQLTNEIESLNEAARTKEIEWNNILYLKKMKEEMLQRLNRKRTVMEIMAIKSIDNPETLFLNSSFDVNDLNMNETKKTTGNCGPATSFIMSRCNMKSVDLAKEKSNLNELHSIVFNRNNQSKSLRTDGSFGNIATSISKSSPAIQTHQSFISQRLRENGQSLLNANNSNDQSTNKMQIGRQGQIKDVQSIIANFRQTHPEVVPRRGRRLKNVNQTMYGNEHSNALSGDSNDALVADIISKRNNDINSPPSSNDSTYSNSQLLLKAGPSNQYGAISAGNFKQAFNDNNIGSGVSLKNNNLLTSTPLFKNQNSGIGYPEVTLHPIGQSSHSTLIQNPKNNEHLQSDAHTNSLLHGILTKSSKLKGTSTVTAGSSNSNTSGFNNVFSPTLARLLTAPERNFAVNSALNSNNATSNTNFFSNQSAGMNLTKSNSRSQDTKPEISCLPISQILAFQQQQPQNNSLLQQQLQRFRDINKYLPKNNVLFMDDEADDSDRLVIDEEQYSSSEMIGGTTVKNDDSHENDLPECQGCKKREAQFVCADCQRQWYCSRECQVLAWDEHSEVCAR